MSGRERKREREEWRIRKTSVVEVEGGDDGGICMYALALLLWLMVERVMAGLCGWHG